MKKGLLFTATLAALTLGLVACGGNGGTPVKDVTINNKDVLQEEWFVEDADRPINMSIEGVRIAEAIDAGDLVVTSSDASVFTVATTMQKIHAVGAGTATLTATYKKAKSDSVQIEVKVRPSMRVVKTIDPAKEDYFLRWKVEGVNYFATDEMNGFYIKPALVDGKKEVQVKLANTPSGDYKYTIHVGTKQIGAYSGSHKNIGFVGETVEDGGETHELQEALFKFNANSSFSTNFFGSTEYFLAAYGGASTDRLAFQTANGIPENGFAKLVEYGDPIPATGISLDKSELDIHAGATAKLTATVTPEDTTDEVVWSTSNQTVATVSADGLVTGINESSTPVTITATIAGFHASCEVTVLAPLNYGSPDEPLNSEEAKKFLDDYFSDGSTTPQHMYVTGLVTEVSTHSRPNIWLQNLDGSVAKYFELYSTILDDGIAAVEVGDTVVCKGYAKIYNGTYELTSVKLETGAYDNPTIIKNTKGEKPALEGVEVSPKTQEVNLYGSNGPVTVQLSAKAKPERAELGTVEWVSGNDNVTVSETGLVSIPNNLVAEGGTAVDVEITVKAYGAASRGGFFYDVATLTVKNEKPVDTTSVTLTAASLLGYDGTADKSYSKDYKDATVDGVEFTYQQIGAYKSGHAGMQFRNKLSDSSNGTKSNLNNKAAFATAITAIEFVWSSAKDIKTNNNVLKITFDKVATFDSADAEVVMLNTVAGEKTMSIAPTGTEFTFVKIEIDDAFTYTCYWDSIEIKLAK